MTRAVGRALAAALFAALLGAAGVAMFYAWHPALTVELDRDPPRLLSGVYSPERDEASGLTFAWTGADVVLRLPGLDRGRNWTLDLRVRGARPLPSDNPDLTIVADGATLATVHTSTAFQDITVTIPARPERRGLTIGLRSSKTFVPGPGDPRPLGLMLDRLSLAPDGVVLVPRPALYASSLASAAMGAAIALLGVTAGSAIGGAVLLSAGVAAVIARGFGPFTSYPDTVTALSVGIALALAGLSLALQYWRGHPLRNTARFAAAFSAASLLLKLLVLLHPDMPIGDAMFHAHRFQGVLGGNLYFTSIAPGGYSFPYPPGLYVFASLFSGLVRRGAGDVDLLRIVTCSADAAAGLLLYYVVATARGNRLAGAMAVAIYHLIPLSLGVLTTGNLTNAFAQSVAVAALALMASTLKLERWGWTALLTLVLAAAYLSHTSTLAIVFAATVTTAALFWWRGGPALRSPAAAIGFATAGAALLAIVVYYAHFMDTYRTELARIGHETVTAAPAAGGRTIGDRLRLVPYSLGIYFGAPVLVLALVGAAELALKHGMDRLTLAVTGWTLSCLAFLLIGILTPVDMRHYLAAVPAVAIVAGYGAAWAWRESWAPHRTLFRAAAAVFLAGAIYSAFHNWWNALG
jgi:hypothetical protein